MERLSALGLSWRHGDLDRIARFTPPEEERPELLRRLAAGLGAQELVYLSTCNRVELVFVRPRGATWPPCVGRPTESSPADLRPRRDRAHLPRVVRGGSGRTPVPDRRRPGFRPARRDRGVRAGPPGDGALPGTGSLGPHLAPLFEDALRLARRIQRETEVGMGRTSLAELALEVLRDRLAETGGAVAPGRRVADDRTRGQSPGRRRHPFGGGQPQSRTGPRAGRTHRRPSPLPGRVPPGPRRGRRPGQRHRGTGGGAGPRRPRTPGRGLAVGPRPPAGRPGPAPDVDPEAAEATGLERVDIQALTERAASTRDARLAAAGDARVLVDEALDRWRRARAERALGPLAGGAPTPLPGHRPDRRGAPPEPRPGGPGRGRSRGGPSLGPGPGPAFRPPATTGLRELAAEHGTPALQSYFRRADRDLADELGRPGRSPGRAPPLEESA